MFVAFSRFWGWAVIPQGIRGFPSRITDKWARNRVFNLILVRYAGTITSVLYKLLSAREGQGTSVVRSAPL